MKKILFTCVAVMTMTGCNPPSPVAIDPEKNIDVEVKFPDSSVSTLKVKDYSLYPPTTLRNDDPLAFIQFRQLANYFLDSDFKLKKNVQFSFNPETAKNVQDIEINAPIVYVKYLADDIYERMAYACAGQKLLTGKYQTTSNGYSYVYGLIVDEKLNKCIWQQLSEPVDIQSISDFKKVFENAKAENPDIRAAINHAKEDGKITNAEMLELFNHLGKVRGIQAKEGEKELIKSL